MSIRSRLHDLRQATGSASQMRDKLREAVRTARTLLDRSVRDERIGRLQAAGLVGERPTDWQLVLGAYHMMFGYILPSNIEFYEHYETGGHWWHQVLRVLDAPATMMDPIGLGISEDTLVRHVVQVVHASAGYDVALLLMFEGGLARLRNELEQVIAGEHPNQAVIDELLERPDYPRALLDALDRFEADPIGQWRVSTVPAPEGCETLFDWGIDTFGTPGRFMAYCRNLPATPAASARAWARGDLRLPHPAVA
ncbi:MAG: hypothetical protein H6737_17500 [Alphaproteobacteria bacterium]|nr:hypothetical protein [Alphaproteobacteria bacterium]